MIREECDGEWKSNFDLFGRTEDSRNAITLYNYNCAENEEESSNLFTNLQTSDGCSFTTITPDRVYLPGITFI